MCMPRLKGETGCTAESYTMLSRMPSPGYSAKLIYIYLALE